MKSHLSVVTVVAHDVRASLSRQAELGITPIGRSPMGLCYAEFCIFQATFSLHDVIS